MDVQPDLHGRTGDGLTVLPGGRDHLAFPWSLRLAAADEMGERIDQSGVVSIPVFERIDVRMKAGRRPAIVEEWDPALGIAASATNMVIASSRLEVGNSGPRKPTASNELSRSIVAKSSRRCCMTWRASRPISASRAT